MTIRLNMDRPYGLISGVTPNNARYIQDGIEFTADKRPITDGVDPERLAELELRADQEAEEARQKLKAQEELEAAAAAALADTVDPDAPVTKEASAEDIEYLNRRNAEAKARKAAEIAAQSQDAPETTEAAPAPPVVAPVPPVVPPIVSQGGDLETMHHMKLKQLVKEAGGEYVDRDQAVAFLRSRG